jgi:hypothetical protein
MDGLRDPENTVHTDGGVDREMRVPWELAGPTGLEPNSSCQTNWAGPWARVVGRGS